MVKPTKGKEAKPLPPANQQQQKEAEPHPSASADQLQPQANAEQPAASSSSNATDDVNELLQQLELAGHVSKC